MFSLSMDLSNNDSTKDKIIELLSYEWPLSLRKIYYLLKKRGLKITYQAVHKAIHQLLDDNKLIKTSDGFMINLAWIKDIHEKTDIIRVNYFSKKRSFLSVEETKETADSRKDNHGIKDDGYSSNESIRVFIFNNWFDLEKYLYYFQKKTLKGFKDKRSICIHHHHEWRPLFYLRAEHNWITTLKKAGYELYTVCSGKTVLDKWSKKFYDSVGNKVIMGIKLNGPSEILIFSDYVVEVYIPFELLTKLDSYLKKIKSFDNLDSEWLIENIFDKTCEIKAIIHKDSKLSDELRKHLISHFK